jgi:serine/threonine-protein phosphatase 2A regulatory subunit A
MNEKVIKILIDWLGDKVFAVRESAQNAILDLITYLGTPWCEKNILPKVLNFANINNFIHRMTFLFVL